MVIKNLAVRKTFSLIIYVALAIVIVFLIVDRHPPVLSIGSIAPVDEKLLLLTGTSTSFKRLLKKPMVINFWTNFCPTCLKELPILSKMARKYVGQIGFLGIAVASDKKTILDIKKRFSLDYDLATVSNEVVNKWQAVALPTTYIVDSKGKILWARLGIFTEEELEKAINDTRPLQAK